MLTDNDAVDVRAVTADDRLLDNLPDHNPDDPFEAALAAWRAAARADSDRELISTDLALEALRPTTRPFAVVSLLWWVAIAWVVALAAVWVVIW